MSSMMFREYHAYAKVWAQSMMKKRNIALILVVLIGFALVVAAPNALAAQLTSRKLTLSTSQAGATSALYTFNFTIPTTGTAVKGVKVVACTTPSGSCTTPTGFTAALADLNSQPTGFGAATGWVDDSIVGEIRMKHTTNTTNPSGSQAMVFNTITNLTTANQTFYGRITTYSDDTYATAIDTGTVAASTATQIQLTGTMDESLVFCVGTSITGQNCATIAGSTVSFGTFSTTSTSTGTSVMAASTNAASGYAITINGATLTSGANTITALSTPTASTIGSSQFGLNLKDNAIPNVGTEVSGPGSGTAATDYNTIDLFKFVTGNTVASAAAATDADTFTVAYIVNVPGSQAAGTYTATMTYICTATF